MLVPMLMLVCQLLPWRAGKRGFSDRLEQVAGRFVSMQYGVSFNHPHKGNRMALQYRVIDREGNNEDHATVKSDASTEQGFLKLFYARWSTAPRGGFYAEVSDGRADIYSKSTNRKVASFISK